MAERRKAAEPSLSGVMDAYAHALLQSFADSSNLFPELLRARGPGSLDRGARTITEILRLLPEAATPDKDQIRRSDPAGALDTTARAILGACFHNSVRPDPADGETARRRYADELGDMAIAYLLTPDRQGTAHAWDQTSLYPSGFRYAWAGSSTNLEQYLKLRARYGDEPAKVGIGVLSYVGYPGLEDWSTPTDLEVYTLPAGVRAQVPAFETWFRLLDEEFGTTRAYPLAAQRDLVVAYSRLTRDKDVVRAFQDVTGCRRDALLAGEAPSAEIGCNRSFLGALAAAGPSPYDGADSRTCFANFQTRYRGDRDASALRGALFQCQDAGFLNTGVGLGYNTYANPFVCRPADRQSVRERYTGREFILPNARFTALPSHVDIPLDLGTPGQRGFLQAGYCR